jgi:hypothetical protein
MENPGPLQPYFLHFQKIATGLFRPFFEGNLSKIPQLSRIG